MISDNDKIEKGKMKLQSVAMPPLKGGNYKLTASLNVTNDIESTDTLKVDKIDKTFESSPIRFNVSAPRFNLDPGLINSVYPLANSTGAYDTSLPHIIFTRKTLPWERTLNENENTPWMTLLLLTEEEIMQEGVCITCKKAIDLTKDSEFIKPNITINDWEKNDDVQVLELPLSLFQNIVARKEELPFLAHTRQVDMSDKENSLANPKGWFSVIVGNRIPQKDLDHKVFLVSLEGHEAYLTPSSNANDEIIWLVLLKQWSFTEKGITFEDLVHDLAQHIDPLRIDPDKISKQLVNTQVNKALKYGYIPLNQYWREGQKSLVWYRGPLVPVDIPNPEKYNYQNADQALRFDKDTGMFDISYSSAWQLGRMLALKNQAFSAALCSWKKAWKRNKPLTIAKQIMENPSDGIKIDSDDLESIAHTVASDEILTDFVFEWFKKNE